LVSARPVSLPERSRESNRECRTPGAAYEPADEYQGLEGLTSLEAHSVFPGTIYFLDGKVELVYTGDAGAGAATPDEIEAEVKPSRSTKPRSSSSRATSSASGVGSVSVGEHVPRAEHPSSLDAVPLP
jgi:hypothetical protein